MKVRGRRRGKAPARWTKSDAQRAPGHELLLLFIAVVVCGAPPTYAEANHSTPLLCGIPNSAQVPRVDLLAGLRPTFPFLATLAREQTSRALYALTDERLGLVSLDVGGTDPNATGPGWDADGAMSDGWTSAAANVGAPWESRLGWSLSTAAHDTGGVQWDAQALGLAEYTAATLLQAHAAGNHTWLEQLNTSATGGAPLPTSLTVPPPGASGGPPAAPLLLLYRRDWWERLATEAGAASAPLPPTWPLLAGLLSSLLNKDLDGDGRADHVLCADLMPGCKGGAVLAAIWASLAQTQGTSQGLWFNATDLSPALDGPALPAALRLYAALAASNAAPFTPGGPGVSGSRVGTAPEELLAAGGAVDASGAPLCGAVNPLFASGRCLFTIDWAPAAMRLSGEDVSGKLGAALLPGSAVVVSTAPNGSAPSQQLQPCSPLRCPHADAYGEGELSALAAVMRPGPQQSVAGLAPMLVNRAPLMGEAGNIWRLATGPGSERTMLVGEFLRLVGFQLGLKYGTLLASLSGNTSSAATALSLATSDVAAVSQAINASTRHPNMAMDILLPYSSAYRSVVDQLAVRALSAAPEVEGTPALDMYGTLVRTAAAQFYNISAAFPYPAILRALYWHSIGFVSPTPRAAPEADDSSVVGLAVGVSIGGAVFLLLSGGALFVWHRRRSSGAAKVPTHSVKPPGPGAATTLALTDVQNSTLLWEVFAAELMDECMAIHHGVMRQAIELNGGYEVFTEGDAFAVAFHGPDDALAFAMDLQMALLTADWPADLLDHPDGCEVWARRSTHLAPTATPMAGSPRMTLLGSGPEGLGGEGSPGPALAMTRITNGSRRLRQLLGSAASRTQSMLLPTGVHLSGSPKVSRDGRLGGPSAAQLMASASRRMPLSPRLSRGPVSGHIDGISLNAAFFSEGTGAEDASVVAIHSGPRSSLPCRPRPSVDLSAKLLQSNFYTTTGFTHGGAKVLGEDVGAECGMGGAAMLERPSHPAGNSAANSLSSYLLGTVVDDALGPMAGNPTIVAQDRSLEQPMGTRRFVQHPSLTLRRPGNALLQAGPPPAAKTALGYTGAGSRAAACLSPLHPLRVTLPERSAFERASGAANSALGSGAEESDVEGGTLILTGGAAGRMLSVTGSGEERSPGPSSGLRGAGSSAASPVPTLGVAGHATPGAGAQRTASMATLAGAEHGRMGASCGVEGCGPAPTGVEARPVGSSAAEAGPLEMWLPLRPLAVSCAPGSAAVRLEPCVSFPAPGTGASRGLAGSLLHERSGASRSRLQYASRPEELQHPTIEEPPPTRTPPRASSVTSESGFSQSLKRGFRSERLVQAQRLGPCQARSGPAAAVGPPGGGALSLPIIASGQQWMAEVPAGVGARPEHVPAEAPSQASTAKPASMLRRMGTWSAGAVAAALDEAPNDDGRPKEQHSSADAAGREYEGAPFHLVDGDDHATASGWAQSLPTDEGPSAAEDASPNGVHPATLELSLGVGKTSPLPKAAAPQMPSPPKQPAALDASSESDAAQARGGGQGSLRLSGREPVAARLTPTAAPQVPALPTGRAPSGPGVARAPPPAVSRRLGSRGRAGAVPLADAGGLFGPGMDLMLDDGLGALLEWRSHVTWLAEMDPAAAAANKRDGPGSEQPGQASDAERAAEQSWEQRRQQAQQRARRTFDGPWRRTLDGKPGPGPNPAGQDQLGASLRPLERLRRGITTNLGSTGRTAAAPDSKSSNLANSDPLSPAVLASPEHVSATDVSCPADSRGRGAPGSGLLSRLGAALLHATSRGVTDAPGNIDGPAKQASDLQQQRASGLAIASNLSEPRFAKGSTAPEAADARRSGGSSIPRPTGGSARSASLEQPGAAYNAAALAGTTEGRVAPFVAAASTPSGALAGGDTTPLPHVAQADIVAAQPSWAVSLGGTSALTGAVSYDLHPSNQLSRKDLQASNGQLVQPPPPSLPLPLLLQPAPSMLHINPSRHVATHTGYLSLSTIPAAMPSPAAGDGIFVALFRDLNAACSALAGHPTYQAAASQAGAAAGAHRDSTCTPRANQGDGTPTWLQAAPISLGGALQLLWDRLTRAEAAELCATEHPTGQAGLMAFGGCGEAVSAGEPELVLRGLRIRVGLHSGPGASEVELCLVDGVEVARYTGDFLATAKEVGDAAVGGMTVLSGAAFRAYQQLRQRARMPDIMLMHVGDHVVRQPNQQELGGNSGSVQPRARELFAAVCPGLLARLALLPSPVRTQQEVVPGCLSAPAGEVAPVFCNVLGVESLLSWEKVVQERVRMLRAVSTNLALGARASLVAGLGSTAAGAGEEPQGQALRGGMVHAALQLLREEVTSAACRHGGYVVASSSDGGHWVLVFGSAEQAVLWGLEMLEAMLAADWPAGFLEHELTEEEWEDGVLVKRGLRLRIGIDYGRAMVRLVPRTGRLDYVGRPMNRAARIAAKAKAATVLASDTVWSSVRPALGMSVTGKSLGQVQLKGVRELIELWTLQR